jgi:uncharacterized protein YbjT (DUF2867 family)
MIVITGATGNTGRRIVETLLHAGKAVTAVGRDIRRLQPLIEKGAKAAVGSVEDAPFVQRTFAGADAVYAMIPPNVEADNFPLYQKRVADALVSGIRTGGVRHVVSLSSVGAHLPSDAGVVNGLHYLEEQLKDVPGLNVVNLRAGLFMENVYGMTSLIRTMGVLGGFPLRGDMPLPFVHTADIARVAAELLRTLTFTGQRAQYVAGPRDLTFAEAATVLGRAIGTPGLQYMQFSYDQAKGGMMQMGLKESLAEAYVQFCRSVNDGRVTEDYKRTPEATTPTTIEDFSKEFTAAYTSGA